MTVPDIVVIEAGPSMNQTKLNPCSNNSNKAFLGVLKPIKFNLNLKTRHTFKNRLCQVKNLRINFKKYAKQ